MIKKTIRLIAMASAALLLLTACANKNKTDNIDRSTPVLSIGDESVSFAMYKALFDNYLPYMQYSGHDPLESESSLKSYRDWLVDILSDDLVTLYQAKQSGFKLTEEQEAQLAADTENEINDLYLNFMKVAEQEYSEDNSIPVSAYFDGIVNSESEYYTGVTMGWEDYKEYYRGQARNSAIVKAYREFVCSEFHPADDDITDWYDSAVVNDKAVYTANPERYKTDEEEFEQYFGLRDGVTPVAYVPSGYSRMMQIVVSPEGELSEEYSKKLDRMDEISREYGRLSFEDAVNGTDANASKMTELVNEYKALKESTDAEYEEYIKAAREKIEAAMSEIDEGKPFAEVMLKYTEDKRVVGDENSEGCKAFREKGELISLKHTSSADWSQTIKDEFKKLSLGERSDVFMEGGSFRIIYYASDETSGEVPLEAIYDDIKAVCTAAVQDEQWDALLTEWKKDPALKINEELLNVVGKDSLKS
ncbi:MAG: hypothetical protein K6F68_09250 [Clostridiales bacterium]|nr:hypothetical protein [Clostridiales bacterium]